MSLFLRKCLISLIAILSFGTVVLTPPNDIDKQADREHASEPKQTTVSDDPTRHEISRREDPAERDRFSEKTKSDVDPALRFTAILVEEAKNQGLHKFGDRIERRIGDQYRTEIAPAFADVVLAASRQHQAGWIEHLAITHCPAPGMGERIIHVYESDTGRDVFKFHVRRDHPPQDGYWFNFHYHTVADGLEQHHELKNVYWGKDTPPKWQG